MSEPRCEELPWTLEVLTRSRSGGNEFQLVEAKEVRADTYFAVRGRLDTALPVLYVLTVEPVTKIVRATMIATVSELADEPGRGRGHPHGQPPPRGREGDEVRLPRAGALLLSTTGGAIHVLAAERYLTRAEQAKLVGGAEPLPGDAGEEPGPGDTIGSST
jgi:hypothetical protein